MMGLSIESSSSASEPDVALEEALLLEMVVAAADCLPAPSATRSGSDMLDTRHRSQGVGR
jgi:hypothetical protein